MTTTLYFNYKSTSKIRFKKENCFEHDDYPCIYRIKTKKLDFVVPKKATIFSKTHVYIPLSIYLNILNSFYKSLAT